MPSGKADPWLWRSCQSGGGNLGHVAPLGCRSRLSGMMFPAIDAEGASDPLGRGWEAPWRLREPIPEEAQGVAGRQSQTFPRATAWC